jgi:hypothetical protein
MVVLSDKPIRASTSFNLPLEPARPYWMLEYVSKSNRRKDYDDNFDKYEKELKVPYYLLFYPDNQELTLYRLREKKFISVKPNRHGRLAVPELDIEVALLDGWVRFWYKGKLLPLPAELLRQLDVARLELEQTRRELEETRNEVKELRSRLETESQAWRTLQSEVKALRAALEQKQGRANGSRGNSK